MSPYVEEPDIPEGMTIDDYRLARECEAGAKGLLALTIAVCVLIVALAILAVTI